MQHAAAQDVGLQRIDQRLQRHPALTHPLAQRRAGEGHPRTSKDRLLAVQRQVVRILGHQHLGQQARRGYPLVNHLRRHRGLGQGLTMQTGPLAAHMALHREHTGRVVQPLGHILTDALHLTATARCLAGGGVGLVANLAPWQVGRQRHAFGLSAWRSAGFGTGWGQLLQLHFDGGDVTIDGLIQQAGLGRVEVFAAFAELPAFQDRQLVGELVNLGLAVQDVLVFAGDEFVALDNRPIALNEGLIPVCDLGNQAAGEFAQLLLAQTGKLLDIDHERQCGIHAPHWQSVQHPIDLCATVLNDPDLVRFRPR